MLDLVASRLEVPYFTDDMGHLIAIEQIVFSYLVKPFLGKWVAINNYHSHFGEVEQSVLCEIGSAFLYKGQVGQVHAKIRDTWWIASMQSIAKISKPPVRRDDTLEFVNRLSRLSQQNKSALWLRIDHSDTGQTVFESFSHVFLSRKTPLLVNAEQIWSTPLL